MRRLLVVALLGLLVLLLLWRATDRPMQSNEDTQRSAAPVVPTEATRALAAVEASGDTVPVEVAAADAPAAWLTGRVESADTGEPIADATVELFDYMFELVAATAVTDTQGMYEIAAPPNWEQDLYRVRARARGFAGNKGEYRRVAAVPPRHVAETLRLKPGVRVAGHVVGVNGEQVSQAVVRLQDDLEPTGRSFSPGAEHVLEVGDDGRFEGFATGDWVGVVASGAVHGPRFVGPIASDDPSREHIVITLSTGVAVEGRVVAEDGSPIEGARIRVRQRTWENFSWKATTSVTSTAGGHFQIGGLAANEPILLWVTAPGFLMSGARAEPGKALDVALRPAGALRVLLQDQDGLPIASSPALLLSGDGRVATLVRKDGAHCSNDLHLEMTEGEILVPGYQLKAVEWSTGQSEVDLGVQRLAALPSARVRIVTASGAPVVGATIGCRASDTDDLPWSALVQMMIDMYTPKPATDAQGEVVLEGLYPIEYRVSVEAVAHRKQEFVLQGPADGPASVAEFALAATASLVVNVADTDRLDRSVSVVVYEHIDRVAHKKVDDAGTVRFDGIPIGVDLTCEARAARFLSEEVSIPALAAGEERRVELPALRPGLPLRCQVVDEDGHPLQAALVEVSPEKLDDPERDQVGYVSPKVLDVNGTVQFEGLAPGIYRIEASSRGFIGSDTEARAGNAEAVRIVLKRPTRYRPRFVFDNGEPIVGARVELGTLEDDVEDVSAITDADGRVDLPVLFFDGPILGLYWGVHSPWEAADDCYHTNELPDVVTIPRGADLRVCVVEPADEPPLRGEVSIFIRAHSEDGVSAALEYKRQQSDRDAGLGCVLAQGVGPGVVDVIVSSRDYEDGITTIELRRGVLSEVTAVMGAAKREVECLVTVVDDDGAPIVGAVVAIAEISAAKPVQSDARGVARLLLRDGTDYEIVVRRKGYGAEFLFLAGGEPTARAVLKPPEEY